MVDPESRALGDTKLTYYRIMVCLYLVAIMTHRTSFSLDDQTVQRIKRLAARWKTSQAEVVRRSNEQADTSNEARQPDPLVLLRAYHDKGGLDKARADQWINEIAEDCKRWRVGS